MTPRRTADSGSIWVAGHDGEVVRASGVAAVAVDLGAPVRVMSLWGDPLDGGPSVDQASTVRLLMIEAIDRADLIAPSLRALRKIEPLADAPVLAVLSPRAVTMLTPEAGHDDFIAWPAPAAELYARIRQLEWRASAYASDEIVKLGPLVIDTQRRTVDMAGAAGGHEVALTAREFSLLLALATRRGRVLTRETLLDVVWGADYEGGAKTVDVHVRRLRAKLGEALPLQTVRGAGYVLK
jgi:DNA-binding response OmpR family regulator